MLTSSWCAFTTFSSIENGARYWNCGFPEEIDLLEDRVADGGLWRQSFLYTDIAHIVIPVSFWCEGFNEGEFFCGKKYQDLDALSMALDAIRAVYRRTELVIEIKLY